LLAHSNESNSSESKESEAPTSTGADVKSDSIASEVAELEELSIELNETLEALQNEIKVVML
jgi:hypothetical protein